MSVKYLTLQDKLNAEIAEASSTNDNITWTTTTTGCWPPIQLPIGDPIPQYPSYWEWPLPQQPRKYDYDPEVKKELERAIKEAFEKTQIKPPKEENVMVVYEVIVVDKKECKVLHTQTVIAKDKQSAMLELDLTPDVKTKNKKNEIEFIFTEKGTFTKVERKVKIEEIKEET